MNGLPPSGTLSAFFSGHFLMQIKITLFRVRDVPLFDVTPAAISNANGDVSCSCCVFFSMHLYLVLSRCGTHSSDFTSIDVFLHRGREDGSVPGL